MTAPLIELAGAGKRFGRVTALEPISLGIEACIRRTHSAVSRTSFPADSGSA